MFARSHTRLFLRALCCAFLSLWSGSTLHVAAQQNEEGAYGEILENFFRDNESATESEAQIFLENLEALQRTPLDLNRASRQDLHDARLLNDIQVENLLRYIEQFGPLLNFYELQAVPGWELDDIRRVQPFFVVAEGGLDRRAAPLSDGFRRGDDELLFRWGRPAKANHPRNAEGRPNAWGVRYRRNFDNRMYFGFTAENDVGEALFKGSNKNGFDFYSAHFFLQNLNRRVRTIAVGDFAARIGQGAMLQTGYAAGKSAESVTLLRGGNTLKPYRQFGEAYFLRGAGVTLQLNRHFDFTAFASSRRRDGNIQVGDMSDPEAPEVIFTSLQNSGLHRSASEIADERAILEQLGGVSVAWRRRQGHVAFNGLHIRYDKPWQPSSAPYRRFAFAGDRLSAMSIDYNQRYRNLLFFGENAMSDNGGTALLNGVLAGLDRRTTAALVYRRYSRDYQAIYASPLAESSGAANEEGIYLGLEVRPVKKWKINAYADLWKHPWLRFDVGAPSHGSEFLLRVSWTPNKTFSLYGLAQNETKQRDTDKGLADHARKRARLHATYKVSPGLELRSRAEWMRFAVDAAAPSKGFLAYQEAVFKPRNAPLSGAVRYAVFDTENYDTRVYTFENDIFSNVSIPSFAGRGIRIYANLQYRFNKRWRVEVRVQDTFLKKSVTSGTIYYPSSVTEQSATQLGRNTTWKVVLSARW